MPQLTGHPRARRLAATFLTALQAQGFAVGVGHHQSVQELLDRLPAGTSDAVLGDSLVAIFATSGAEQKLCRDLFHQSLAAVNAMDAPTTNTEEDPIEVEGRNDLRRLLLRLGGLALVILALVFAYLKQPDTEFILPDRTVGIMAGTRTPLPNLDSLTEIGRVGEYAWPGLAQPGAPTFGRLDTIGGPLIYEAPYDTVRDAFTLTLSGTERRKATVKYNIVVLPDTARTQVQREVEETRVEPDFSPIDPLPHPRSLADLAPVEAKNDGYAKFFYYAWWPLMLLVALILLRMLYEFLRYLEKRKLRLVAQREQSDGAPHFWRIELPELRAGIDWGENYPALLRQLRRRREDEYRELDLNQTISRTIEQGGLPSFHYRSATRPAEYLLLIDRGGANNHHARLFEQLYQQLVAEEVLVARYFYDGDPRLLYQHDRGQSTPLTQLQRRFPNARLLMVGSGDRLIHPATGKLAKWVEPQLGTWTSRSLLTTLAPSEWGRDERRLATFFSVLPASMQGLRLLVERINDGNSGEAAIDYRSLIDEAEQPPVNLTGSLIGSLRQSFTTPQLQWIAACALYPTLHWDLTLFFGQTISDAASLTSEASISSSNVSPLLRTAAGSRAAKGAGGEVSLLTSKNLLSLARLPWFINGSIPPVAREELTEWLQKSYPALHRKLRLAMLAVLEKTTPPPVGSVAHRELDFFRLQNEWLLAAPESPERARLAEDLARKIANGNDPDITVARFMEAPEEDAIVLPQSWNERLYPEGLKGLGVKPEVRRLWWGVPLLVLLGGVGAWFWPVYPASQEASNCSEDRIPWMIQAIQGDSTIRYTICSKYDSIVLEEWFWSNQIENSTNNKSLDSTWQHYKFPETEYYRFNMNFPSAKSISILIGEEPKDSIEQTHRENLGAMLWNRGLELLDSTAMLDEVSCPFFFLASEFIELSKSRKLLISEYCLPDLLDEDVKTLLERAINNLQVLDRQLAKKEDGDKDSIAALRKRISDWATNEKEKLLDGSFERGDLSYYRVLVERAQRILSSVAETFILAEDSSDPVTQTTVVENSSTLQLPSVFDTIVRTGVAVVVDEEKENLDSIPMTLSWTDKRTAEIIYVKEGRTGSGRSWNDPVGDLRQALHSAYSGDEVWVGVGEYRPGKSRETSFVVRKGVKLYGGFSNDEEDINRRDLNVFSTLSGEIGSSTNQNDNSFTVVIAEEGDFIIDRFTITGGFGRNYAQGFGKENVGGGAFISGPKGLVSNVIFSKNKAHNGGAVFISGNPVSNTSFIDCVFKDNTADFSGGAVYNNGIMGNCSPIFRDCRFEDNASNTGAGITNNGSNGIASPLIIYCLFINNVSILNGAAIYNIVNENGEADPTIESCNFIGNESILGNEVAKNVPITPHPQMQPLPAGTFQMGDTFEDNEEEDETVHEVSLSAFELARYELTFEEYDLYCDSTGVDKPDDEGWGRGRRPVINVSWEDAVKYCNWLSGQHGYEPVYDGIETGEVTANWAANGYRLPTEAEWEYAASYRSDGTKARFGNGKDTLRASEANFRATEDYKEPYSEVGEYREKTLPVGSFPGNDRELRDMDGNVYEWCWDWYGDYGGTAVSNPRGPVTDSHRVIRGGSWFISPSFCRAANRDYGRPPDRNYLVGFRLARSF